MALVSSLFEILQRPRIGDVIVELIMFMAPLWIAVFVGVLLGWAWKPKWANLGSRDLFQNSSSASASASASPSSLSIGFSSIPSLNSLKLPLPSCVSWIADNGFQRETSSDSVPPSISKSDCSSSQLKREGSVVTVDDIEHLCQLVEEKDGGPAWIQMMQRSTPNMYYQAWRRDPETGPPQYRSRTVYEDITPELVRDFFWDDDFRSKWDDMLLHAETLEECSTTGTMIVQWVRKFPFFCSDREYIIGRRIWELGRSYYCVTKGVPFPSVPRRSKPRRVDLYYSSWCIRAVESKRGDGQLTACEVLLFHHEDMGIPWEIAKLGVRQGMWGAVKKIDLGLRAYQRERASRAPLSHCAFMAQVNTKVSADYLRSLESTRSDSSEVETLDSSEKPLGRNIPKFLVIGGAIVLACRLDCGLLTKAVIFGVARRFAKIGKRL
uniref:START domain-containing protein n=1 Tax=Davidia involucrata TaxID=16924 RepID=A0A5B7AW92_DAVIN